LRVIGYSSFVIRHSGEAAMTLQEVVVVAIVALALAYWLSGFVRLRNSKACGSGCGKCSAPISESKGRRIGLPQVSSDI